MTSGRRAAPAAAALLLLVALVALAACGDGASTAAARWYVAPDADPGGDAVPIVVEYRTFCEAYAGVDVVERDEAVEITVRLVVREDGDVCPDAATAQRVDVPLAAPLGARTLGGPGHEEAPVTG